MKPFRQSHAPRKLIWKPQVHNGHALQSDANIFDCCWFHLNVKLFVRVMARTLLARTGSTSGQRWRQVQRWAMRKMKYSHNAACHAGDWKLWKHNASARAKRRRMADGKWEIGNGRGQVYSCLTENQINRFYCFGLFILAIYRTRTVRTAHTWPLCECASQSMSHCRISVVHPSFKAITYVNSRNAKRITFHPKCEWNAIYSMGIGHVAHAHV